MIGHLLDSLGVSMWAICDLIPSGIAKKKYASLCVKRSDLFEVSKKIISTFNHLHLLFYNFTPCAIPQSFPRKNIITNSKKCEENNFISYDKKGTFDEANFKGYANGLLGKIEICKSCIFTKSCNGFWLDYLKIFGEEDFKNVAIQNDCIKL